MIIIGAYFNNVDNDKGPTTYLMVGGTAVLVFSILKFILYLVPHPIDFTIIDVIINPLMDVLHFGIVIWGSVEVFGRCSNQRLLFKK